jgi:hypothetical protein
MAVRPGRLFTTATSTSGQGEEVRGPFADATLGAVPGRDVTDEQLAPCTALSDVMCTCRE